MGGVDWVVGGGEVWVEGAEFFVDDSFGDGVVDLDGELLVEELEEALLFLDKGIDLGGLAV